MEAKKSAVLLICDGSLLEPTQWPKGSQAPWGVLRVVSGLLSRPCGKRRAPSLKDGGISRSFLSCTRKPWVPSTCAGDLSELLRVPLRSQEYCRFGRAFLGRPWVWWNGRGPHLELRQETQGSSPFLTPFAESLQSGNRRVWPHLVLKKGTPLASRVVHRVTGHLSSCIWNLWVFLDDATGVSVPLVL